MSWCPCPCWPFSDAKKDLSAVSRSQNVPLLSGENVETLDDVSNYLRPLTCEGHGSELENGICTHSFNDVYILKDHLGKGSTSSCYKCIHRRSGNMLAVKVIDKRRVALMFNELLTQFRQEVEVLRVLSHPHIIRLFEVFESDTTLHVITEYVQGGELFDYLVERPDRLLSEAEASGIIRQVAWALAYMHREGVMHRDLKLENILVAHRPLDDEEYPTIKIIDFGLAKKYNERDQELHLTQVEGDNGTVELRPTANTFFGTVGYIAPEMIKRKGYTSQVDNWALGVLTYVLLCGIFPFDDDPNSAFTRKISDYVIKFPPWATLSDSAKDLLKHLLEVNPNKRMTAGKAMVHPWVAGETASKIAVLGTPKLLEELRINHMYGHHQKVSAFSNNRASVANNHFQNNQEYHELRSPNLQGSVSPLVLDENIRKTIKPS